jgi:DNA-binding Lrp family transcriptional regulator
MSSENGKSWRFVTNHRRCCSASRVMPDVRLRDVAEMVGITERAVQRIVADLVESGFLQRERVGRRSRYVIDRGVEMRHPAQAGHDIGELLALLALDGATERRSDLATP